MPGMNTSKSVSQSPREVSYLLGKGEQLGVEGACPQGLEVWTMGTTTVIINCAVLIKVVVMGKILFRLLLLGDPQ